MEFTVYDLSNIFHIYITSAKLIFHTVLYAPYISALGLDMTRKVSRVEAWKKESPQPVSLMDYRAVWYPETASYAVCSIKDGIYACQLLCQCILAIHL